MTIGSLFSGVGGLELGLSRALGWDVIWQAESDSYCREHLARHWPAARRYEDVRHIDETAERVRLICGGFPCQDISLAGSGAGLEGARSGLWFEYARIVGVLRPEFVVVENVSALLVRGLGRVLGDLAALGYDSVYDCIPASAVGAPHRRDRLFVVARRIPDAECDGVRDEPERRDGAAPAPLGGHAEPFYLGAPVADSEVECERPGLCASSAPGLGRGRSGHGGSAVLADAAGPRPQGGAAAEPAGGAHAAGDGDVADPDRHGGHTREQSDGQSNGRGQNEGGPLAQRDRDMADSDGGRREGQRLAGEQGRPGEPGPRRNEFDGSDLPLWPPSPDDVQAWGAVPAYAQPSICRLDDGFSTQLARRRQKLQSLGNAVVPAVAEIIGLAIRETLCAERTD